MSVQMELFVHIELRQLTFGKNLKADGLSASMPLLLHNWREVYELWLEAFQSADDKGL